MKIAFLSWTFYPSVGGAQIFSIKLIEYLVKNGHEVHVYLPSYQFKETRKLKNLNFKIFKISNFENFQLKFTNNYLINKFVNFQKRNKYDVWQVIGSYPAGYLLSKLKKIVPIVLRTHGNDIQKNIDLNYGIGLNPVIDKKIDIGLQNSSKLIALTNDVKNIYLNKNINENKIIVIPNAVNLNLFNKREFKKINKNKKIKILSVGRYHKKKGYNLIPEAIKKLIKNNIDFSWTIIGKNIKNINFLNDSALRKHLILIDELAPSVDNKNLLFPSKELLEQYEKADVFVMTSYLETFGMVLIEAMASGLYIVSSNSEGCRDVIKNYRNGVLYEKGDTSQLVFKINELLEKEDLQLQIHENMIKDIENYKEEVVFQAYLNLYKDVINSH